MTRFLQPLDIGVNKPFKYHMKDEYLKYIADSFNGNKNKIEEKFQYSNSYKNISKSDI